MKKEDIFLYKHNGTMFHGIYMKTTNKIISNVLPDYKKGSGDYLVMIFDNNGLDYFGQMTEKELSYDVLSLDLYVSMFSTYDNTKHAFSNYSKIEHEGIRESLLERIDLLKMS